MKAVIFMRLKNNFFYTLRENAKDEDSLSGNLLVRSGMIKKSASGIYMFMPLGLRVKQKVENIIRKEMNEAGANEVFMPFLISADIFAESGRLSSFGDEMFKLKDRYNREYLLGPTHEETFTTIVRDAIKSYKKLPLYLYQIQILDYTLNRH